MEAEKKRREQRRIKELQNGQNGEGSEEGEGGEGATLKALPLRKHQSQTSRSMSPAVGRMMNGSQSTTAALSQNSEPSFAQSIRRGDNKQPAHVLAMMPPDTDDYDAPLSAAMSGPPRSPSVGPENFEGGFVSFLNQCYADQMLTF